MMSDGFRWLQRSFYAFWIPFFQYQCTSSTSAAGIHDPQAMYVTGRSVTRGPFVLRKRRAGSRAKPQQRRQGWADQQDSRSNPKRARCHFWTYQLVTSVIVKYEILQFLLEKEKRNNMHIIIIFYYFARTLTLLHTNRSMSSQSNLVVLEYY